MGQRPVGSETFLGQYMVLSMLSTPLVLISDLGVCCGWLATGDLQGRRLDQAGPRSCSPTFAGVRWVVSSPGLSPVGDLEVGAQPSLCLRSQGDPRSSLPLLTVCLFNQYFCSSCAPGTIQCPHHLG